MALDISTKNISARVSETINEYLRVLKLARKPTREEFIMISKIAGAGLILIGVLGFIIYLLVTVLPGNLY